MDRASEPSVSVIVPTRNRKDKLVRCLNSVYRSAYRELEVVVVDDASSEPVGAALSATFPTARFIRNEERRLLSCSRNAGAAASRGEYLFFLDDDNVLAPDAIPLLVGTLGRSERVAVSAPIIFYMALPDTVWTSYITRSKLPGFYTLHNDVPPDERRTFSFHNSFMVKRTVFEQLGGFDCANFPIRFGEVDFAHRIGRAGYIAIVNPRAKDWHDLGWSLVHIDSARAYYTERNRMILLKRYFSKTQLRFYEVCLLPFLSSYYLLHHSLSSSDGGLRAASRLLKGVVDGLRFPRQDGV